MRPTDPGKVLLHHASKVLKQVDYMNADLVNYGRRMRGYIRLYANSYAIAEYLVEPVTAFLKLSPDIDLTIEEHLSEDVVEAVEHGLADVGIVANFIELRELESRPFRIDRLVAVAAPGFDTFLDSASELFFNDLLAFDFIGLGRGSRLQNQIEEHARDTGRPLRHRVQLRNLDAACRLIAGGAGVGIVPQRVASRLANELSLKIISLKDDWASHTLQICFRKADDLSADMSRLLAHLLA